MLVPIRGRHLSILAGHLAKTASMGELYRFSCSTPDINI